MLNELKNLDRVTILRQAYLKALRGKVKDVCETYIKTFNQDAVGLLVTNPMRFVTKVSEVY